jgi:serine/threonine protein kinase
VCPVPRLLTQCLVLYCKCGGYVVKIADFDISCPLAPTDSGENIMNNLRGSPGYRAPEIWQFDEYPKASDIWAIRCLILFLVFGQEFMNKWSSSLVRLGEMSPIPDLPSQYYSLLPLLRKTLRIDKQECPTAKDLLKNIGVIIFDNVDAITGLPVDVRNSTLIGIFLLGRIFADKTLAICASYGNICNDIMGGHHPHCPSYW